MSLFITHPIIAALFCLMIGPLIALLDPRRR